MQELEQGDYAATGPRCARSVLMVEPADFSVSSQSALDNPYMNLVDTADAQRALAQSRDLARLISAQGIEVNRFPGRAQTPDDLFPNNVFATTPGRFIIGHMLHPVRQKEAQRKDIRAFFQSRTRETVDLSQQECIAELTGTLIVDSARHIGFCGLSGRVDPAGLEAMHRAFGLKMTLSFEMQPGEYHTNVIMMILASRTCVLYPGAFLDPAVPETIARAYPDQCLFLNEQEKNAFAANCIALTDTDLFMSKTGLDALRPSSREYLEDRGFVIHSTELDEIEKAGGSLRCMIAECF